MIVSLTITRYRKRYIPFALIAMAAFRLPIRFQQGCTFWQLMGSGKKGTFDLNPDWQQWALMACWDKQENFDQFYNTSFISKWWRFFNTESWTILCEPIQSHGKWDCKEPFSATVKMDESGPVAVITRATIRIKRMKPFWASAAKVAELMKDAKGLVTSFGIGEMPAYKQATFSIWENTDYMKEFAYRSVDHKEVIQKTKAENWYSEELFARFKPIATFGTLHGADPLKGFPVGPANSLQKENT